MTAQPSFTTYLFSDIEGSTRLWELEPDRMKPALASHDAASRAAVEQHGGVVIKMTGDGVHAAFDDPLDALRAMLAMHVALATRPAGELKLRIRFGLHGGHDERRDGDFFGPAVNRAARIMSAAHGGQMLLSEAVAVRIADRLPEATSLRDLGLVRLRDLARPERVYQVLDPRFRADFPALRSLEATPNNLPVQLNSFVGRERELVDAKATLRQNRLVTLLGMGGLGKSRLSIQLAAEVVDDYPDGVWLVELAPIQDPRLVAQEVASVLSLVEEGGRPVVEALVKFVRDRRLLLILDNCEHLVAACAELAKRLLQAGPELKIVATSRDYLQIAGEAAFHVPTLGVPDPRHVLPLNALAELDAVQLFIDRAVAVRPDFALRAENAAAVAEICHRLDGIPLAIELAAARMRALSAEALAARLADRFRLLVTGDRTVLPRQRTLRALIDWSYDLLPADERSLFHRLSVFAGGWALEAVEAVGSAAPIAVDDVLELLSRLVEKSLVVVEAGGGRYRLLDTVRQYALEKLSASGEEEATRARHRDFFIDVAEKALPMISGPDQGKWLARQDLERENFSTALSFEDGSSNPQPALRLVDALVPYWVNRGLMSVGLRATEDLLARRALASRSPMRARGLFCAGQISYYMGRYSEAIDFLAESLAIARESGDRKAIANVLQPLGTACLGEGALPAARRHLEEAYALAHELGDKRELAAAANALAMVHRLEGNLTRAESLYIDALALGRDRGDREVIAIILLNLAMVSIDLGATRAVRSMLLEVLDIAEDIGSKHAGYSALEVCSGLASASGDAAVAVRLFGIAEAQIAQTGLQRDPADEAFLAPWIEHARKSVSEADFADARASGSKATLEEGLTMARAWLDGVGIVTLSDR